MTRMEKLENWFESTRSDLNMKQRYFCQRSTFKFSPSDSSGRSAFK